MKKKKPKKPPPAVPATTAEMTEYFAVRWAESNRIMERQRELMDEIDAMATAAGFSEPVADDDD